MEIALHETHPDDSRGMASQWGAIPDIGILVHPDSLGSELSQTAIGGMIAMV